MKKINKKRDYDNLKEGNYIKQVTISDGEQYIWYSIIEHKYQDWFFIRTIQRKGKYSEEYRDVLRIKYGTYVSEYIISKEVYPIQLIDLTGRLYKLSEDEFLAGLI